MNNDLGVDSAIWRALFGVRALPLLLLVVCLSGCCQRAAENGFAADDGSVSGDGHSSRCCTVGELLQDCDSVSVMAVQEKCDEKRQGRSSDFVSGEIVAPRHVMDRGADQNGEVGPVEVNEWEVRKMKFRPPGCVEPGPLRCRLRGGPPFGYRSGQAFSKSARSGAPPVVTLPTLTTATFSRVLEVGHPPPPFASR
jgi:hypothetical protein